MLSAAGGRTPEVWNFLMLVLPTAALSMANCLHNFADRARDHKELESPSDSLARRNRCAVFQRSKARGLPCPQCLQWRPVNPVKGFLTITC